MRFDRRQFLRTAPVFATAAVATSCGNENDDNSPSRSSRNRTADNEWQGIREQFLVSPDVIDVAALLIASNPRPVREAIERHRRGLDENPTIYLENEISTRRELALQATAQYMGVSADDVALTDSTTMGLGLMYSGFRLRPNQEFLHSEQDYYSSKEAIRVSALRTGSTVRTLSVYDYGNSREVSADEVVNRIVSEIQPETRVVATTWVHSSTGVKLPVRRISDAIAEVNRQRANDDRVLLCVDGVHGFGVEDATMQDLGCDFFAAGCHKWLFGPRGTGLLWANGNAWRELLPSIPSFRELDVRRAWIQERDPSGPTTAARMQPGGFKAFEHQWALPEAFEFLQGIGKTRVAERTHALARQLKEGLADMQHVTLHTPISKELSAGIVCFEVAGLTPPAVVQRLRGRKIVATTTPYSPSYARFTPSIRNTPEEMETILRAVHELG